MAREIFWQPFHLIDTSTMHEKDFRRGHIADLMLLSLYRAAAIDLKAKVNLLVNFCQELSIDPDSHVGRVVLEYNINKFEVEEDSFAQHFGEYIEQFPGKFKGVIMNFRQATLKEGRAEGRGEGRAENSLFVKQAIELIKQKISLEEARKQVDLPIDMLEYLYKSVT